MSEISAKVLQIATSYLGPASKTFLERQTKGHMGGLAFDDITKQHLPDLAKWVKVSAALVIDAAKADELANRILRA